jgi:hypothetical protein
VNRLDWKEIHTLSDENEKEQKKKRHAMIRNVMSNHKPTMTLDTGIC